MNRLGVDFQQGGRRAAMWKQAAGEMRKRARIRTPTLPAAMYLLDGADSEWEREGER